MYPSITQIVIYAKDVAKTVRFYDTHFGFTAQQAAGDRIVELVPAGGGARLLIHPAGKGIKTGVVAVKLVFDVDDVAAFKEQSAINGLVFGAIHQADGYTYANGKDPDKNSIQISSRKFK